MSVVGRFDRLFVNSAREMKDLFEREGVLYMRQPVIPIIEI